MEMHARTILTTHNQLVTLEKTLFLLEICIINETENRITPTSAA
jgi:hypothetical protein